MFLLGLLFSLSLFWNLITHFMYGPYSTSSLLPALAIPCPSSSSAARQIGAYDGLRLRASAAPFCTRHFVSRAARDPQARPSVRARKEDPDEFRTDHCCLPSTSNVGGEHTFAYYSRELRESGQPKNNQNDGTAHACALHDDRRQPDTTSGGGGET